MPGWNSKSLRELATFHSGLWKGEKPPYICVGVIRNTNFAEDGSIDDSDIAFLNVEAKKFEKRKLRYGDIILEKSGGGPKQPVGRVALFEKKGADYSFSNFTAAIRVNDPSELDFRFLHKFLLWKYASGATETMQSHSTGIRNLNADAYKEIAVPLPPVPEQQRIIAILDDAFARLLTATTNTDNNLKNARGLFESQLEITFSSYSAEWQQYKLRQICSFTSGGTPSKANPAYWTGNIPWVSGKDMKSDRISDAALHISQASVEASATRIAPVGSLLILVRGMGLANGVALAEVIAPCAFNQDIKAIHPNRGINPRFLLYALRSRFARSPELLSKAAHGTLKVEMAPLTNFPLRIPPMQIQEKIVSQIDSLKMNTEILARLYNRKADALTKLKRAILQKAFSGELTSPPSQAIREAAE